VVETLEDRPQRVFHALQPLLQLDDLLGDRGELGPRSICLATAVSWVRDARLSTCKA